MEFIDRTAENPNRFKITYEDSGSSSFATIELADNPIEVGTPLNKATFDEMQKELLGFKREITSSENMDDLLDDGVYFFTTATVQNGLENAPFENAAVVMVFGGESKTTQKIQIAFRYGEAGHGKFRALYNGNWNQWADFTPAFEDEDYKRCFYRFVGSEKEWINPPLVCNDFTEFPIEYRTSERWNGMPVYTFAQKMTLEANTDLTTGGFALSEGSIDSVVRFDAKTSNYHLPYDLRSDSCFIDFRIRTDTTSFTIERGSGAATKQETLYIQLWYTKK